jgi:NDP-sugar pyrophosphorylase family protein
MKPTLLILAGGMGSRYGKLKQLDEFDDNGETIMDYSIYDAIKAGFGKIVFVIRHAFEKEFREKIIEKYEGVIPIDWVFQELNYLPEGFTLNIERTKPWGTNHAILQALKNRTPHLNGEKFLSNRDVCKMFHISSRTLQDWRDTGKIPFIQIKGKIFCIRNRR